MTAIASAISQEDVQIQVVVCLNGPGADYEIDFPIEWNNKVILIRDKVISNANAARNACLNVARGEYVAFLDDDDYWLPQKLKKQIQISREFRSQNWLITSSAFDKHEGGVIFPKYGIKPDENPIQYLFVRKHIRNTHPTLLTSSWFGPKSLFIRNSFDESTQVHQDWEWLIRTYTKDNIVIRNLEEPMVVYGSDVNTNTESRTDWNSSLEWILKLRPYMTKEQIGSFIINVVHSRCLKKSTSFKSIKIFFLAFKYGAPNVKSILSAIIRSVLLPTRRIMAGLRDLGQNG